MPHGVSLKVWVVVECDYEAGLHVVARQIAIKLPHWGYIIAPISGQYLSLLGSNYEELVKQAEQAVAPVKDPD